MDQSQLELGFWPFVVFTVLKMLGIFTLYMVGVAYTTLAERKISAWIQDRHGPNRVGPWGLFQVLADGVKNIMKEETLPGGVNKPIFILAPAIAFVPALIAWAVIPFGAPLPTPFGVVHQVVADLPIGFLFTLGIASLGVYGIVLAGWSSNNKYALLGGLRASAQMVSYEITMGMAVLCVLLVSGNVSLNTIIAQQQMTGWNAMVLTVAGFLFLVSAFAETNRVPFDMPEAESELIAGYHSEYSAMKFSMFPISEYANMVTTSAMFVTLFLGGWDIPFTDWDNSGPYTVLKAVSTFGMFAAKVIFFVFFYIWIRWTLPRFRYDQLMSLGWQVMLPVALIYLTLVSAVIVLLDKMGVGRGANFGYAMGALNIICVVLLFFVLDRGRLVSPASARLSPEEVERLRRRAPARATLTPEEIR